MKTLSDYNKSDILSINELLLIKGGVNEEDPKPNTDQKPEEKKDDRDYVTIDTEFDFWLEPEI